MYLLSIHSGKHCILFYNVVSVADICAVLCSEVGDLAGKFGVVYPNASNVIVTSSPLVDNFPPYIANYKTALATSLPWSSVVFHCGAGLDSRLLCGEFMAVSGSGAGTACASAFSSFATLNSPTSSPTVSPTVAPTSAPSFSPTVSPSVAPTPAPVVTSQPTVAPTTAAPSTAVAGTPQPTVTPVTTAKYCATFNPQTAAGASGYFAMEIVNGQAYYAYEIDLSKFGYLTGTCSQTLSAGGLKYHIHSYWNNASTTSSAGGTYCGKSLTGGHYDPGFACSSASQNGISPNTYCAALGRVSPKYNYSCTPSDYVSTEYSFW